MYTITKTKRRRHKPINTKRRRHKQIKTKKCVNKRKQTRENVRTSTKKYGGNLNDVQQQNIREILTNKKMDENAINDVLAQVNKYSHYWSKPDKYAELTQLMTIVSSSTIQGAIRMQTQQLESQSLTDGNLTDTEEEE